MHALLAPCLRRFRHRKDAVDRAAERRKRDAIGKPVVQVRQVGGDRPVGNVVDRCEELVRELARTHAITHLLGHHEVMGFRANAYYVERDRAYRNEKSDPGAAFMAKVRAQVADLGLAGP